MMRYLLFVCLLLFLAQQSEGQAKRGFMRKHNKYRRWHGAEKLQWDNEIAIYAQKWCDTIAAKGRLEHSPWEELESSDYGENLAYFGGVDSGQAEKAVENWYNEVADYDFNNPGFSSATGHFTQVVWKGSERLGCGMTKKGSAIGTETYVCCNYKPRGNYRNQFEENVLPELRNARVEQSVKESGKGSKQSQ